MLCPTHEIPDTLSTDYENTRAVAEALYSHTRVKLPYGLTVLGY